MASIEPSTFDTASGLDLRRASLAAGVCLAVGLGAGLISVVPVLEQPGYFPQLAASEGQLIRGALAQVAMAPAVIGVALALHPVVRRAGATLALGFVGLRLAAGVLHLAGAALLPLLLEVGGAGEDAAVTAEVLRRGRDLLNHGAVVIAVAGSDLLLFTLLRRRRLAPSWLTTWGIAGAALAIGASVLVLGRVVEVVSTPLYLALTAPAALHLVVLTVWLLTRGLSAGRVGSEANAPAVRG